MVPNANDSQPRSDAHGSREPVRERGGSQPIPGKLPRSHSRTAVRNTNEGSASVAVWSSAFDRCSGKLAAHPDSPASASPTLDGQSGRTIRARSRTGPVIRTIGSRRRCSVHAVVQIFATLRSHRRRLETQNVCISPTDRIAAGALLPDAGIAKGKGLRQSRLPSSLLHRIP